MDMTKQSNLLDLNNISVDTLRYLYSIYFSSNTNTSGSFYDKIELLTLLSYLSQQLCKRMPDQFKNSLDVLNNYIYKGETLDSGIKEYVVGLSVVCDDLLYGVNDLTPPTGYSSSLEIKNKIKTLINAWTPF